jgi:hypothetical protein
MHIYIYIYIYKGDGKLREGGHINGNCCLGDSCQFRHPAAAAGGFHRAAAAEDPLGNLGHSAPIMDKTRRNVVIDTTSSFAVDMSNHNHPNALHVDVGLLYNSTFIPDLGVAAFCCGHNGLIQLELARAPAFAKLCERVKTHLQISESNVTLHLWCVDGRHYSVGCGELLKHCISHGVTDSCETRHHTLFTTGDGPCGCDTPVGCNIASRFGYHDVLFTSWGANRTHAKRLALIVWMHADPTS